MRKYGKGFVRKDRGTWAAVVSWQEDGKQRRVSKSTGIRCYPDKKDPETGEVIKRDNRGKSAAESFLKDWRDALVAELNDAEGIVESTALFYDYANHYYDLHHAKASTMSGYHAALTHLVGSECGNTPVCDLTADDFRRWEKCLYDDGLKENTIAHYHAFLAQVLKHAVGEGDLSRSPIGNMRAPRRRPKPVNSLTPEGVTEVSKKLDNLGTTPVSTGARIALMTGMRRSEICALRWQDVDLERREIHVVHSLTKGGGFSLDTPKDPSGKDATRTICFGKSLLGFLEDRKRSMKSDLDGLGDWDDGLYVIGNAVTGDFENPEMLGREWSMLARAEKWTGTQGEIVRFHDLRHTFATLAIANKMDVMTVAGILGHRDATTTLNIYATALEESKRSTMNTLDTILYPSTDKIDDE